MNEALETDIVARFRSCSKQHGELTAVAADGASLFYWQLDKQSDQLAGQLRAHGVGRESVVGFLMNRSVHSPVGFIGILKSGGAYLPLDSEHPVERLRYIVENAQPGAILTTRALAADAQALNASVPVVILEDAIEQSEHQSADHAVPAEHAVIAPDDLAVVLYTSGSTGQPKGVELTHRSLVNYFTALQVSVGLQPGDTGFATIAYSFDMSIQELLLPLLHGGCYRLLSRAAASDGAILGHQLGLPPTGFLTTTPVTLKLLWQSDWTGAPGLTVITGGEILTPNVARFIHSRTRAFYNIYGPAEATVAVTLHRVTGDEERVPIGAAIANSPLFVLDEKRAECGFQKIGELYIGGVQVARGYRNRPELTAERFVTLTLPNGKSERAYRTGDLVSRDTNGELQFHGRRDNQIKLRGHRIELEEIEHILASHPLLSHVSVQVRKFGENDERLVAFASPRGSHLPEIREMREFIAFKLPEYMVPAHIEILRELPKTVNGKIDRNRLLTYPVSFAATGANTSPQSATEARLLKLWQALKGFETSGTGDNFFDLGGHSLLAAHLFAKIREEFDVQLPLSLLLTSPTVQGIAAEIDMRIIGSGEQPAWSPVVRLSRGNANKAIFVIHALGGNLLSFEPLIAKLAPHAQVFGLQARGLQSDQTPHTSIEAIVDEYTAAICAAWPSGPYVLAGYSAGGIVAFEVARRLLQSNKVVEQVAILDCALDADGKVFQVSPFRPVLASAIGAREKFANRSEPAAKISVATGPSGPQWMNPIRSMSMETRILLRRFLPHSVMPEQLPDSFVVALRRYQAQPLDCPAVVFRAMSQRFPKLTDASLGWSRFIKRLTVHSIEGNHWTIMAEPKVDEIASVLLHGSDLSAAPTARAEASLNTTLVPQTSPA